MCHHSLIYHDRNAKISMLFSGICLRYCFCYLYAITLGNKSKVEACKSCFPVLDVESGGGGMVFQAKSEKLVCFLNAKSRNSGKTKSKWLCLCDETVESEKEARRKVFSALNSFYRLPKLCFNL